MAARRLIIVLVLLLAASIAAASIAPDRTGKLVGIENDTSTEETSSSTSSTTSTSVPIDEVPVEPNGDRGEALNAHIEASERNPETVDALVGDQLSLTVAAKPPRSVAIPPLGLTEFAAEDAPARFDLLLREPGAYPITDGEDPAVILGRLRVRLPREDEPQDRGSRAEGQGRNDGRAGK